MDNAIDRHAPGAWAAFGAGLVGFVCFWGVAGWPIYALYLDYFTAAAGTWGHVREALRQFPAPAFSMMFTAGLLGAIPMLLWLTLVAAWVTRAARVRKCLREIRLAHEGIIRELLETGLLRVRLSQSDWQGCRVLLGEDAADGPL
jgi:hypothetical protein